MPNGVVTRLQKCMSSADHWLKITGASMQKFRTRAAFVEAFRWPGNTRSIDEIPSSLVVVWEHEGRAIVTTPEGDREVHPGDWIVKDESGAYLPMGDDIFKRKYEPD
jgi:hypothetical protein